MTYKSIFKTVVLTFFITFTLAAIGFFVAGLRRIPGIGASTDTGGITAVAGGVSAGLIRLILIAVAVGVVVITYLVLIWRKLKR
jgi:type III secretory pathway component EscU